MPPPAAGLAPLGVSLSVSIPCRSHVPKRPEAQRNRGWKKDPSLDLGSFHFRIRKREPSRRWGGWRGVFPGLSSD